MYKNELDKHIQNGSLSNSFVFFGECNFLIDTYTDRVTNIEDASLLKFYHDEYNFNTAKAHLSQSSLFGGQNILIIKSEKKIPKKDLDIFINYCEKNPDNIFVYAYYGDDYTTYAKAFNKTKTMGVRFFNPNLGEAISLVAQIAKEKSVNIDNFTISHLLNIHNVDVALASNEIEKFRIFDKAITTKDVDNLVFGLAEINIDELIKKILNKKDFKSELLNVLGHGENGIRIITAVTSYITTLYMFNIYIRINGTPNALEILGYNAPKFVVDEKAALSLKFRPSTYHKLHNLLLESELKMKSSNTDTNAILLSTLIKIQTLI